MRTKFIKFSHFAAVSFVSVFVLANTAHGEAPPPAAVPQAKVAAPNAEPQAKDKEGDKANAANLNPNDPNVAPPSTADSLSTLIEPFDYDPRGRRDPFAETIGDKAVVQGAKHGPLLPLQQFELSQLQLTGILWNVKHPKAMFRDPKGGVYVVGTNGRIGPHNGYIASIREGEIVIVETTDQDGRLVSTTQVMRIAK